MIHGRPERLFIHAAPGPRSCSCATTHRRSLQTGTDSRSRIAAGLGPRTASRPPASIIPINSARLFSESDNRDFWLVGPTKLQESAKGGACGGFRKPKPDWFTAYCIGAQGRHRIVQIGENPARIGDEALPRPGKCGRAAGPVEQADLQIGLQFLDLPAKRRLFDTEARSRAREVKLVCNY